MPSDIDHDFSVRTDRSDGAAVVSVAGQADLHTAPELRDAIGAALDGGHSRLVVDLSETTFIDSMTLGVLLGGLRRVTAVDGRLVVVCPDPHLQRVFQITSLDRVLTLVDTLPEARRRLSEGS